MPAAIPQEGSFIYHHQYVRLVQNIEAQLIPADALRVIVFEREGGRFFVNQHLHHIVHGSIYVIPPTHSYLLKVEAVGNMMGIDIPMNGMTDDCRQILYSLMQKPNKALFIGHDNDYYQVLKEHLRSGATHPFSDELLSPLSRSAKNDRDVPFELKASYLEIVDRYFRWAATIRSIRNYDTTDICNALNVHRQTLQRAFREILNSTIKNVLNRQILSEAVYLLSGTHHSQQSMSAIAYRLGFSNESDFARYFKKNTDMPPTEFRKRIRQHTD